MMSPTRSRRPRWILAGLACAIFSGGCEKAPVSTDTPPAPKATPLPAPAPGERAPRPPLVAVLGIDGDGLIEAAGITQAAARLKSLDKDGDGILSIAECLPAPGGPGGPMGGGPGRPPLPPILTTLDANGDAKIDAAEIAAASTNLIKLDRNGDGKIGLDECLPAGGLGGPRPAPGGNPADPLGAGTAADPLGAGTPAGPLGGPGGPINPGGGLPRPPLITILDTNGDGFIDATEIAQAPTRMKLLDRDGDGVLSLAECLPAPGGQGGPGGPMSGGPPGGPPGGGPGRPPLPPIFTTLDGNGDGKIDAAEIAVAPSSLLKLDRNGDGRIGLDECLPNPPGRPGNNAP